MGPPDALRMGLVTRKARHWGLEMWAILLPSAKDRRVGRGGEATDY